MFLPRFQKAFIVLLVSVLFVTQIFRVDIVFAESAKTRHGIVAVLVADDILKQTDLASRVMRYANDGQRSLPGSKFLPIRIAPGIQASQIQMMLEKLYFEGDGTRGEYNRLIGVVLVGDVPFPIVKRGNDLFPSIYPYTDFHEKAYIYNSRTDLFEENNLVSMPAPEIWHGVIKPPVSGVQGYELLRNYFDRNHDFHVSGDSAGEYEKKIFYADLHRLKQWIVPEILDGYLDKMGHQDTEAYSRYTGALARSLLEGQEEMLNNAGIQVAGLQQQGQQRGLQSLSDFSIPDIHSVHVIRNIWKEFYQVAQKYVMETNALVENSGRWNSSSVDTPVSLISKNDRMSQQIIFRFSEIFENALDQIVEEMQRPVVMVASYSSGLQPTANYVNGISVSQLSSAQQCSLYAGSADDQNGSQRVEANRLYNPATVSDTTGYAGCHARNIGNPSACNPRNATRPVRDITGTRLVESAGFDDFRECFAAANVQHAPAGASNIAYHQFSSVIRHKEPTAETLSTQLAAGHSRYLPADAVRYLTFQGGSGNPVRINYLTNDIWNLGANDSAQAKQDLRQMIAGKSEEMRTWAIQENIDSFVGYLESRYTGRNDIAILISNWQTQTLSVLKTFFPAQNFQNDLDAWEHYMRNFSSLGAQQIQQLRAVTLGIFGNEIDPRAYVPLCQNAPCAGIQSVVIQHRNILTLHEFIISDGDTVSYSVQRGQFPGGGGGVSFDDTPKVFRISPLIPRSSLNGLVDDAHLELLSEAIMWKNFSTEEKMKYVLEKFSGGTATPFPGKSKGYEASFIVASGDSRSIDIAVGKGTALTDDREFFDRQHEFDLQRKMQAGKNSMISVPADGSVRCPNGDGDSVDVMVWVPYLMCWLQETLSPPLFSFEQGTSSSELVASAASSAQSASSSFSQSDGAQSAQLARENQTQSVPAKKTFIQLLPSKHFFDIFNDTEIRVQARVLDEKFQLIEDDSDTIIQLRATAKTGNMFSFPSSQKVANGVTTFLLAPQIVRSGGVHLIAESDGITGDTLRIPVEARLGHEAIRAIQPNALYTTFLGAPVGDLTESDYLGGWLLFDGKSQAVTAAVRATNDHPVVFSLGNNSYFSSGDTGAISIVYEQRDNGALMVRNNLGKNIAKIYLRPNGPVPFHVVSQDDLFSRLPEGILIVPRNESGFIFSHENVFEIRDQKENLIMRIDDSFRIESHDPIFRIEYSDEFLTGKISFAIKNGPVHVATVIANIDFGAVKEIDDDGISGSGIFVELADDTYRARNVFTASSHHGAKGFSIVDTSQTITRTYGSKAHGVEDIYDIDGIGWKGDYKNMLLYAAGNIVGNAMRDYASDIEILLGDPLISIQKSSQKNAADANLGFDLSIGERIYRHTDHPVGQTYALDFNNDKLKDVITVLNDGTVKLFRGVRGDTMLEPMGTWFQFSREPDTVVVGDFSRDQYDDVLGLIDGKIHWFFNEKKALHDRVIDFGYKKITSIAAGDMNRDSYLDLIFSNAKGEIFIAYGSSQGLNSPPQKIFESGIRIRENDNLAHTVFIRYPGMALVHDYGTRADNLHENLRVEKNYRSVSAQNSLVDLDDQMRVHLTISNISNSRLASMAVTDTLNAAFEFVPGSFTCQGCKNDSGEEVHSSFDSADFLYVLDDLSLARGERITIAYNISVKALPGMNLHVGYFDKASGIREREDRFSDILIIPEGGSNGVLQYLISNEGRSYLPHTVQPAGIKAPAIQNEIVERQSLTNDQAKSLGNNALNNLAKDSDGDGIPDIFDLFPDTHPSPSPQASHFLIPRAFAQNSNAFDLSHIEDAAKNILNNINGQLSGAANAIEKVLRTFFCGGSCIEFPLNYAFLAPGPINILGIPGGFDAGAPIFWDSMFVGAPPQASGFRIYFSPTTTLGAVLSFCSGPYLSASCVPVRLPVEVLFKDFCEELSGTSQDILSGIRGAKVTFLEGADLGIFSIDAAAGARSNIVSEPFGFEYSIQTQNLTDWSTSEGAVKNKSLPSFPEFFSGWFDRQMEEITNSLSDFPDIIVYYPDINTLSHRVKAQYAGVEEKLSTAGSFNDVLKALKNFPFLDIKVENIVLKFPWIDPKILEKISIDFELWQLEMMEEAYEFVDSFSRLTCGLVDDSSEQKAEYVKRYRETTNTADKLDALRDLVDYKAKFLADEWERELERKVQEAKSPECLTLQFGMNLLVQVSELVASAKLNQQRIQEYAELPRTLVKYYEIVGDTLRSVSKFLDSFFGIYTEWMQGNIERAKLWMNAIYKFEEYIHLWKYILNITADYKATCNLCKSDRFSLKEFMLKFFVVLPELPIIPIPNWPDVILDFSSIKAGVPVSIPNLVFAPEHITFPPIPRIKLPRLDALDIRLGASIAGSISIPALPILPPVPELPDISFELPSLPKLKLPILPLPPRLPELFQWIIPVGDTLQIFFKVVCLLDQAVMPVQEGILKTQVENLTQRPSEPLLPIDLGIAIDARPLPALGIFPDFLKVRTHLEFRPLIFDKVASAAIGTLRDLAAPWNQIVYDVVSAANRASRQISDYISRSVSSFAERMGEVLDVIPDVRLDVDLQSSGSFETYRKNAEARIIEMVAGATDEFPLQSEYIDYLKIGQRQIDLVVNAIQELSTEEKISEIISSLATAGKHSRLVSTLEAVSDAESISLNDIQILQNRISLLPGKQLLAQAQQGQQPAVASGNVQLKGRYIASGGVIRKLMDYDEPLHGGQAMADFDGDGDLDIVYAMGHDLYIKRSQTRTQKHASYGRAPVLLDAKQLLPQSGAINMFSAARNNIPQLKWLAPNSPASGYVISVKNSIDGFESATQATQFVFTSSDEAVIPNAFAQIQKQVLSNPDNPSAQLNLENGHYYFQIFSFENGRVISTPAHNVYAKKYEVLREPVILPGAESLSVPIFSERTISADNFMNGGEDAGIFWDLNADIDSDNDGDTTNDNDYSGRQLTLGPYNAPGIHRIILNAVSTGGSRSQKSIDIHVFVPRLLISESRLLQQMQISGSTDPSVPFMPVGIVRERKGTKELLTIDAASGFTAPDPLSQKYITDSAGTFMLRPFVQTDGVQVIGPDGAGVARVLQENGRIVLLPGRERDYEIEAYRSAGDLPVSLRLTDLNGEIFVAVYFIPEVDSDVVLHTGNINAALLAGQQGVHVIPRSADLLFDSIPGDNEIHAGGVVIADHQSRVLGYVTSRGNILLNDQRLQLRTAPAARETDPVIFQILLGNETIADVYIAARFAGLNEISVETYKGFEKAFSERDFDDVAPDSPYYAALKQLVREGIIQGYGDNTYRPERLISRAEFLKIVLGTVNCESCENVTEDVKQQYDPMSNNPDLLDFNQANSFSQLAFNIASLRFNEIFHYPDVKIFDWFYYCVEMATRMGIVQGYRGESPTGDNAWGLFLPHENISRAEAAKVFLEAARFPILASGATYDRQDEKGANLESAWYYDPAANYIHTAVQMDLLVPDTNQWVYPERKLTRGEMAEMAFTVLQRLKSEFPDEDFDNDGISNREDQCICTPGDRWEIPEINGCYPRDPDEVRSFDDEASSRLFGLASGIYIVKDDAACQMVEPLSELMDGDIFYAVISDRKNEKVWRVSNKVQYTSNQ